MTEDTGKIQGGRFQPGQSGNPAGRPKGSLNRASTMVRELMADEAESITRKLIELAQAGEIPAIRLVIERLLPPIKELHLVQEQNPIAMIPGLSRFSEYLEGLNKETVDGV